MERSKEEKRVDQLVKQFWRYGYLTVKRKYGTYLNDPEQIGNYDIDAIGRQLNDYAIGITLTEEDFNNPTLVEKITFLSSRHTKYTHKNVQLIIGTVHNLSNEVAVLLNRISPSLRKNVKVVYFPEKKSIN